METFSSLAGFNCKSEEEHISTLVYLYVANHPEIYRWRVVYTINGVQIVNYVYDLHLEWLKSKSF